MKYKKGQCEAEGTEVTGTVPAKKTIQSPITISKSNRKRENQMAKSSYYKLIRF